MAKITALDAFPPGTAAGNVCYLCRRHPRDVGAGSELVVDTGVQIDFEGGLAFCATCVAEMGRAVGMVAGVDVDHLRAELATALEDTDTAQSFAAECLAKRQAAEDALVALASATAPPDDPQPATAKRRQAQPA